MAQAESFRTNAGTTYPILQMAGSAGVGADYATGFDAFFVVDAEGIIRYRRTIADGAPAWRPAEVGAAVDAALDALISDVGETPSAEGFRLGAAYPNPFNPSTRIPYRLDGTGDEVAVELRILDVRGRALRTLVSTGQTTGRDYEVLWDGRDDAGQEVPSGTYMASLVVRGTTQARFLTLVK